MPHPVGAVAEIVYLGGSGVRQEWVGVDKDGFVMEEGHGRAIQQVVVFAELFTGDTCDMLITREQPRAVRSAFAQIHLYVRTYNAQVAQGLQVVHGNIYSLARGQVRGAVPDCA